MTFSSSLAVAPERDTEPCQPNIGALVERALEKKKTDLGRIRSFNAPTDNLPFLMEKSKVVDVSGLLKKWRFEHDLSVRGAFSSITDYSLLSGGPAGPISHIQAVSAIPAVFPREYATVRELLGILVSNRAIVRRLFKNRHRIVALGRDLINLYHCATVLYANGQGICLKQVAIDHQTTWSPLDLFAVRGFHDTAAE